MQHHEGYGLRRGAWPGREGRRRDAQGPGSLLRGLAGGGAGAGDRPRARPAGVRRGRAHAVEPAHGLCDLRRAAKPRRALPEGPSMKVKFTGLTQNSQVDPAV